jgi:hypothetical protein
MPQQQRIELRNELGRALRWHRDLCGCDGNCEEYLDIAREYTAPRIIR